MSQNANIRPRSENTNLQEFLSPSSTDRHLEAARRFRNAVARAHCNVAPNVADLPRQRLILLRRSKERLFLMARRAEQHIMGLGAVTVAAAARRRASFSTRRSRRKRHRGVCGMDRRKGSETPMEPPMLRRHGAYSLRRGIPAPRSRASIQFSVHFRPALLDCVTASRPLRNDQIQMCSLAAV